MRRWLRAPAALSRWTLLAIAFVLGTLAAGGVVAGSLALKHAAAERDRAIAAERLTAVDVAKIAERIFAIEQPSRAQLLERIRSALRACARDPLCRRSFQETIRRAAVVSPAAATRPQSPARRDASRRIQRPPTTRRRDGSPPPGAGDPSPADPSPGPSAPNVELPMVPAKLCTPLVGVNC